MIESFGLREYPMTPPSVTGLDLTTIRRSLAESGRAYVSGLPNDFDHVGPLSELGPLVPQYDGALVRDIKPDPTVNNDIVSSANMAELTPHTEWYEFPGVPPRYVALWCVRPASGAGGETTLADGYALLDRFSIPERDRLMDDIRIWRTGPALEREGVSQAAHHPIIERHGGSLILRFSTLDMRVDDDLSQRYITEGRRFFEETKTAIRIDRGGLLVWDNWRMMHARNAFRDQRRHLRRALIAAHP